MITQDDLRAALEAVNEWINLQREKVDSKEESRLVLGIQEHIKKVGGFSAGSSVTLRILYQDEEIARITPEDQKDSLSVLIQAILFIVSSKYYTDWIIDGNRSK